MNLSLYYAALEHRDGTDPEVVTPSVSWKADRAKQRIDKALAEPGKI